MSSDHFKRSAVNFTQLVFFLIIIIVFVCVLFFFRFSFLFVCFYLNECTKTICWHHSSTVKWCFKSVMIIEIQCLRNYLAHFKTEKSNINLLSHYIVFIIPLCRHSDMLLYVKCYSFSFSFFFFLKNIYCHVQELCGSKQK